MIIAEIGQAHDGSIGMAHSYIEALKNTGVDAIKFQVHIAAAESSIHEPFRVPFSYADKSRMDYWKRIEFDEAQWVELIRHCEASKMKPIASPFSLAAVDLLERVGVKQYKIGSGEVTNLLLLERVAQTGKPVIISSGMSSYQELDAAVNLLQQKNIDITILQCTTAYPTAPEQWGLNMIADLKRRYNLPTGFSDHSGNIYACLAATALGAEVIEFHVVFDQKMFGPDSSSSIEMKKVTELVTGIREIRAALKHPADKNNNTSFDHLKNIFEKSLAVNKDLPKGHAISFDDLETKKPKGHGIDAFLYKQVIGKVLAQDKKQWDFLKEEDLESKN